MGNISKVYYEQVDPKIMNIHTAGEFYFYHNLIGLGPMFHDEYERSETNNINVRNQIVGNAKRKGLVEDVLTDNSMLAISSLWNKVIVIV